jgi:PAS domain S-box-containing protein
MNLVLTKKMNVKSRPSGKSASRERKSSVIAIDDKKILALLENAPDATLIISQEGHIAWANARAATLLSRSADDLPHTPLLDLIPEIHTALFPHDAHAFFAEPTDHRAGQKSALTAKCGDGTDIWIDISFSRLELTNGTFTWAAFRELPTIPVTDDNPRKTHTYARSLIEASMDPQISNEPDGTIGDVNEAMVQVTGVTRENLLGTPFAQYFTEPRKAEEAHQQAYYKGSVLNYPLSIRHVSGKITDVLYNARVYKGQNGVVQGVYASLRDITERKQAEEEMKMQQAYTRSLIEASLDPLVTISPEGKITDVNEASVRATGVSRWNLIGTDFSDYFTEPERAREGYEQVFAQGFVADYPLTIRHNLRKVLYNASVYKDERGRVLGVFAAARDISAQSKQEVRINKLNEELEQRILELESFSYSVSHDLRAPLRGIDGFIAIFLTKYFHQVDAEGQRLLANVRRNVNKMGSLIDELLTLSRIGMKDIQIANIDMFELVNTVLEELSELKGKCSVVIKTLVPAKGDVALIKQVLVNLISNAFKYSAKKSKPVIEIGCYPDEGETQYYIRDNGVGFDMEYSNKLFGVFQRLHDPEEYQGTGVGLAIVKRIITRHGGSVWAVGKEGEGATFYFTLKS